MSTQKILASAVAAFCLIDVAYAQRVVGINCFINGRYVWFEGRSTCPPPQTAPSPSQGADGGMSAWGQLGFSLGSALGAALFSSPQHDPEAERLEIRRRDQEARRWEEEEQRRRDEHHGRLASSMRLGGDDALGPRLGDESSGLQMRIGQDSELAVRIGSLDETSSIQPTRSTRIQELVRAINSIEVPPPIPAEDAALHFKELPDTDRDGARLLVDATDLGVLVLELSGTLGGTALPVSNVLLVTGKTILAAEDGADIYLTRKGETYDKALAYLKEPKTRAEFSNLVRLIREGKPIPENARIDMVRAAQAILDPSLGNTGIRTAWDAMWSPEAKNAALTKFSIEASSVLLGAAAGEAFYRIEARRVPVFASAVQARAEAVRGLRASTSAVETQMLEGVIRRADKIIGESYITAGRKGIEVVSSYFTTNELEEMANRNYRRHGH